MKVSTIIFILAFVPVASALKGSEIQHRNLIEDDGDDADKGDDADNGDDADDGGSALPGGIECFSGVSTVQVQGKGSVTMKDLRVGDSILTGSGSYSEVSSFGHFLENVSAEFLQIHTADQTLEMTGDHLVFLNDKLNPIRTKAIKVGDVLRGETAPAKVTKIQSVQRQGIYAPLTMEGSLVVDGIVASSYVSMQKDADEFIQVKGTNTGMSQHDYVHLGLAPFRLVCQGVSKSFCDSYDDYGMPHYVRFAVDLNEFADSQNPFIQCFILLVVVALCSMCSVLENVFGASWAPLVLVLGGAAYATIKTSGVIVRAKKAKTP